MTRRTRAAPSLASTSIGHGDAQIPPADAVPLQRPRPVNQVRKNRHALAEGNETPYRFDRLALHRTRGRIPYLP